MQPTSKPGTPSCGIPVNVFDASCHSHSPHMLAQCCRIGRLCTDTRALCARALLVCGCLLKQQEGLGPPGSRSLCPSTLTASKHLEHSVFPCGSPNQHHAVSAPCGACLLHSVLVRAVAGRPSLCCWRIHRRRSSASLSSSPIVSTPAQASPPPYPSHGLPDQFSRLRPLEERASCRA